MNIPEFCVKRPIFISMVSCIVLILGGVAGVLQPTTSALLHNMSTLGISVRSMTNLLPEKAQPQPAQRMADGIA